MPHTSHGTKNTRKRKNSNPSKNVRYKVYESPNKEDPPKMATSEMCVDDSIREDNMNFVANGESCHLLAISEQVKEKNCFLTPHLRWPPVKL